MLIFKQQLLPTSSLLSSWVDQGSWEHLSENSIKIWSPHSFFPPFYPWIENAFCGSLTKIHKLYDLNDSAALNLVDLWFSSTLILFKGPHWSLYLFWYKDTGDFFEVKGENLWLCGVNRVTRVKLSPPLPSPAHTSKCFGDILYLSTIREKSVLHLPPKSPSSILIPPLGRR